MQLIRIASASIFANFEFLGVWLARLAHRKLWIFRNELSGVHQNLGYELTPRRSNEWGQFQH